MVPLAGPFLLRPEAPPLPPDVPTYTLSLTWEGDVVRGEGTVEVPNATGAPLAEVSFLLHGNDGPTATTRVTRVEGVGRSVTVDADVRELLLHVSPPVPPGAALTVSFGWEVAVREQPPGTDDLLMQGLMQLRGHAGEYGLQAHGDGVTVLASGYPMLAPRVGGAAAPRVVRADAPIGDLAWNGPARWDVTVAPPPGVRVVTNLADEVAADGRVRARGEGPWDLVVVGYDEPPVVLTQEVGGVVVRSWARRRDAEGARAALAEATHALRFLERYGPYPYRELDVAEAALSGGAGGVEFGGLALVASFLYTSPGGSSPLGGLLAGLGGPAADTAEMRSFVVAHEVAHQWSPGMLVADAWAQPIVDEPLAQYLAWRVVAGGRSTPEADALFDRQVTLGYASMRLLGGSDGVAGRETTAFPDALSYGGLVYGKAPHLYRALHDEVGAPALDRALAAAFAARAWTAVDGRGWLALLEQEGAVGAVASGERWWWGESGDADLGLDPDGHAALRMMLGDQAPLFEAVLARTGMTPAAYFGQLLPRSAPDRTP
jgi:hypothetical protein